MRALKDKARLEERDAEMLRLVRAKPTTITLTTLAKPYGITREMAWVILKRLGIRLPRKGPRPGERRGGGPPRRIDRALVERLRLSEMLVRDIAAAAKCSEKQVYRIVQDEGLPQRLPMSSAAKIHAAAAEHPDWTPKELAAALGVHRTTIYGHGVGRRLFRRRSDCTPEATLWFVAGFIDGGMSHAEACRRAGICKKTWENYLRRGWREKLGQAKKGETR